MPWVRVQTNGAWAWVPWEDIYGPQPLVEHRVSSRLQARSVQALTSESSTDSGGSSSQPELEAAAFGGGVVSSHHRSDAAPYRSGRRGCGKSGYRVSELRNPGLSRIGELHIRA